MNKEELRRILAEILTINDSHTRLEALVNRVQPMLLAWGRTSHRLNSEDLWDVSLGSLREFEQLLRKDEAQRPNNPLAMLFTIFRRRLVDATRKEARANQWLEHRHDENGMSRLDQAADPWPTVAQFDDSHRLLLSLVESMCRSPKPGSASERAYRLFLEKLTNGEALQISALSECSETINLSRAAIATSLKRFRAELRHIIRNHPGLSDLDDNYCVFRRNRTPIPKESGQRSDNCRTEARGLPDTMTERSDAQGRQVAFSNSPVKLRSAVPSVGRAFRG